MKTMRIAGAIAGAMIAVSCSAQSASLTMPTEPQNDTLRARLTLPSGFTIQYFAAGLSGVRFMAVAPDGAVYASIPKLGQVVRLADTNGDGAADTRVVAVSGLDRPHGLAFHNGWLYVAWAAGVSRVHLKTDGTADGAPQQIATYDAGGSHWTRSIAFGTDGAMYIAIGSTCNLCIERAPERASVMRYDDNGANGRRYAYGLRNAVGIAVNPVTHEVWVSQNERDNLTPDHENLPPDEINILHDGGDYGWPYCYTSGGAPVPNPEYNNAARCAVTVPAALELQAHSAPLGISFLASAAKFPIGYRGDLLVAFHGSWNRSVPTGDKVVRVRITNDLPVSYEDFITGFALAGGQRWGRPVDVAVTADGAVLISDDVNGAIYRVAH
jgi:glucose/arabinose dehydrogenase